MRETISDFYNYLFVYSVSFLLGHYDIQLPPTSLGRGSRIF